MTSAELLADAFGRVREDVHRVVDGVSAEGLGYRVNGSANSIAWLVWHLTRVQDDHVAEVAGLPQVWTEHGWVRRFGLPLDEPDTRHGPTPQQGAQGPAQGGPLTGDHHAGDQQTTDYGGTLTDGDPPPTVERRW